jgi:hypothetical protein
MQTTARIIEVSTRRRAVRATVAMFVLVSANVAVGVLLPSPSSAAVQAPTTSHYEATTDPATLLAQGQAAGHAGSQGLVILDFGRPAVDGSISGTEDFNSTFVSFASIVAAAESYVQGYFTSAPDDLQLDVAVGTNNSCGPGQPCGSVVCGCELEPQGFAAWGAQLAAAVEQVRSQTNESKVQSGYTDTVTIMAGDDAEPAFDPEYQNTYNLMAGYANAVEGYQPAMIDYGSADPGFWSEGQLLQIADGFKPNLAVPEIYTPTDVAAWTSLVSYAKASGQDMTIYGVLTAASAGNSPEDSYSSLVGTLPAITGQSSIRWLSTISH